MYDLYNKLKEEDARIYECLIHLRAHSTLAIEVSENMTKYELELAIGVLENRLGIKEWHFKE